MQPPTEAILAELPEVARLVAQAVALETARTGVPSNRHDIAVQCRAAELILSGAGEAIRRRVEAQAASPEARG